MQYLMVQNPNQIPLNGIRLLGATRKAPDKIGQFGTGLKETIALLLRKGIPPIIFSGLTRIDFSTQDSDGESEIAFKLTGEGTAKFPVDVWHGMGMSPDFGKIDWTSGWQILREVFCNALDEGGIAYSLVEEMSIGGVEGKTRIYVEAISEIHDALQEVPNRLLALGEVMPLDSTPFGVILPKKPGNDKCNIFTKGVFVQTGPNLSFFDYECHNLKLNESRSSDWYYVHAGIASILGNSKVGMSALLQCAIGRSWDVMTEAHVIPHMSSANSQLVKEVFEGLWGDAVVCETVNQYKRVENRGMTAIQFPHDVCKLLQRCGCKNALDILPQSEIDGLEPLVAAPESQRLFDNAWKKISFARLNTKNKPKPKLVIFQQLGSDGNVLHNGMLRNADEVWINERLVGGREERVTMLEEIGHYCSDAPDNSRDFQNWIFDALDIFMFPN